MKENERSVQIIDLLVKEYPHTQYYLHFNTPLELLVAAILSAQVRDEVVNSTTPKIFTKYKTAVDYANADLQEFINDIKPISFPSKKAENIIEACKV
ncbi:endonuclease III, partial [bacterium]|nr:endonuclease III [bacterium]